MKKLILISIIVISSSFTSGCSHQAWVQVESNTRVGGLIAAPMGLFNTMATIGKWATSPGSDTPETKPVAPESRVAK